LQLEEVNPGEKGGEGSAIKKKEAMRCSAGKRLETWGGGGAPIIAHRKGKFE